MRRPWLSLMLPALALGVLAGCAPTATEHDADDEEVVAVEQAYEVGPTDVYYHITWYADDADPPASYEEPLVWTREFVTTEAGLLDWQPEMTWGFGKQMIVTPDLAGATTVMTYLATVPVPPIGSRLELTIGDPGRRW